MKYLKFFLLSFLIGCSNLNYAPDYEKSDVPTEKLLNSNAIIVSRLSNSQEYGFFAKLFGRDGYLLTFLGNNNKDAIKLKDNAGNQKRLNIKLVKPGYYEVSSIIFNTGSESLLWSNFGIGININKSEVLYIGDIIFDTKNGTIRLEDNFNEVKQVLEKETPELLGKLKKNITWMVSSKVTKILEELSRLAKQKSDIKASK